MTPSPLKGYDSTALLLGLKGIEARDEGTFAAPLAFSLRLSLHL